MNKGNICILMLLISLFFVSCVIDVSEVSKAESDGTENRDNIDNKGSVQNDESDNQKIGDIKFDAGVGIVRPDKPVIKLEQGDIEKLKIFIDNTNAYKDTFELIDDQYGRVVNEIRTYSPKNKDDEEERSKSSRYFEIIKERLTKLNENNLIEKFKKLEEIIKKSTNGVYDPQGLTTEVDKFKETVKKALETLSTNDAFVAREAADSYFNALHAAIIAYIDTFDTVASTLSSSEFTEAARKLALATRDFANTQDNIYAFRVIIFAVRGLVSEDGDMSMAKRAIRLIHRHETEEGQALLAAIDNLQSVYYKDKL
ncbi:hypothetical protein DB313_05120 (plasmid) [Borrelia turcica IST7]|uniref:Lipoprotein n=1 Tax=Borrelia turcica IST7 TaxID=1104446 RepID=A0A386PMV9_9SPIR|nr:hypothetical protein [Borrelia turcica]AYE36881.1 hypothetical protein DB313_05120 [Borrelia turcica IST7]